MSPLQAAAYGALQGATEFLPISSSAHLTLLPWFFGWKDPGLGFDVGLHGGTLLAILAFFREDFLNMGRDALRNPGSPSARLGLCILLATLPGGLAGLLLESQAQTLFRHPVLVASMLIAFGLLLGLSELRRGADPVEAFGLRRALGVGLAQALAILPGVSRSGVTITAGLFLGLAPEASARFSFLLAAPITAAAFLHEAPKLDWSDPIPLLVGFLFSALSGYAAILFLSKHVRRFGFKAFVYYRLALGLLILGMHYGRA